MDDFFPLFQRGREGESLRRGKSVGRKTEKTKGCRRSASYIDLDDRVLYTITFYLIEPVLLLSRVFLFLGLFEDPVIEDVATPWKERCEAMSRFSFTIARTRGPCSAWVEMGWKTPLKSDRDKRKHRVSWCEQVVRRENPRILLLLLFYFDRDGPKKRKACGLRVGGTSLHVGTFPALADIRVAERKSERT